MARNTNHQLLHKAKKSKSDECYTQLCDIESELQYYQNCFEGKVVYCNCDDPRVSNFFQYFVKNFKKLGLKKLIASCYREDNDADLFNFSKGYFCEVCDNDIDENGNSNIEVIPLNGDGDFRSDECVALLRKYDIVVTNPPFSLFREFVSLLAKLDKQFLIIGNVNAITYKEIFELIQSNKAWLGINLGRGISGFIVPEKYELYGTEVKTNEKGQKIVSTNNCLWLTNLNHQQRNEYLILTKLYAGNEDKYPTYENCKGINVDRTQDIPSDYNGLIGVPITFLHKYNPEQFEIIKFRKGDDDKDLRINGKCPYFRILVKNRRPAVSAF